MNIFYITITIFTLLAMLADPVAALATARTTLNSWWSNVLPALLPFFIISEICNSTGLVRALGTWLDPIMRPLFRLPGPAAIALLLGFFSGSPTGGAVAANLRAQGLVTHNEGERIVAFCNNTGPLYLLITASSLLGNPAVGLLLATVQYPVNLLFGIFLRFFAPAPSRDISPAPLSPWALWRAGWQELHNTPALPPGLLLRSATLKSLTTIGIIGAFMLIFSLLINALTHFGVLRLLMSALYPLASLLGLSGQSLPGLAAGFFEMTLGLQTLAETSRPLFDKTLAAAVILGWCGISIHIQIAAVCAHTDLSLRYYLPCRALHALLAPLILRAAAPAITTNSSTLPMASWPLWLSLPGAMLAPAVLLLFFFLLLAFGKSLALTLLHRR